MRTSNTSSRTRIFSYFVAFLPIFVVFNAQNMNALNAQKHASADNATKAALKGKDTAVATKGRPGKADRAPLDDATRNAISLGITQDTLAQVRADTAGKLVMFGSTWAHAVVSIQAPWVAEKTGVTLDEALAWASTAMGRQRGWTLRFSDGGTLSCVRRNNPNRKATWTPGKPEDANKDVRRSSHSVKIGNKTVPGWVAVPNNKKKK